MVEEMEGPAQSWASKRVFSAWSAQSVARLGLLKPLSVKTPSSDVWRSFDSDIADANTQRETVRVLLLGRRLIWNELSCLVAVIQPGNVSRFY
jgi:hypothetical protein